MRITVWYKIATVLGILFGGICILKTYKWIHPTESFSLQATILSSESCYGLELGCPVFYMGFPVGKITSIELEQDQIKIKVTFYKKFTINKSTCVMLGFPDLQLRRNIEIHTPVLDAESINLDNLLLLVERSSSMDNALSEILNLLNNLKATKDYLTQSNTITKTTQAIEEVRQAAHEIRLAFKAARQTWPMRWLVGG